MWPISFILLIYVCIGRFRWPCGVRPTSAGIEGSNPAEGMDVYLVFVVPCVGIYFCDGLITHSEESYQLCFPVYDLET